MEIQELLKNLIESNKSKFIFATHSHETIKLASDLLHDKCASDNLFITEGLWSFPYIKQNNIKIKAAIINPESVKTFNGIDLIKFYLGNTDIYIISEKVLNKLTNRNDENGIYLIGELPAYNFEKIFSEPKSIICVLDGIEKAGNIGTILRSCDATKIDGLIIVNRRAKINNTTSVKGSMGGFFTVPTLTFGTVKDCWRELSKHGYTIYLADTRAEKDYFHFEYENKTALIMGSERYGISKEWYETEPQLLKLKMLGACDSLNVGVATSILLYDIKMKQLEK